MQSFLFVQATCSTDTGHTAVAVYAEIIVWNAEQPHNLPAVQCRGITHYRGQPQPPQYGRLGRAARWSSAPVSRSPEPRCLTVHRHRSFCKPTQSLPLTSEPAGFRHSTSIKCCATAA